jgi:hypothetical protein
VTGARALAAAAVLAALAAAPRPAGAFTRMHTPDGVALWWPSNCAYFTLDAAGSDDLPLDLLASAVVGSFNAWQSAPDAYITFQYNGLEAGLSAGWMGGGPDEDVIKFIEADWTNSGDPENPRPTGAIALTQVFFDPPTGVIKGADMELNGADFTFTITTDPLVVQADVANTVTHEAGHFIGIGHNCYAPGSGLSPGEAPNCDTDPPLIEATMYWQAPLGELKKRSLEADDVAAVSFVYPLADDPGRCEEPGFTPGNGGGTCNACAVGAAAAGGARGGDARARAARDTVTVLALLAAAVGAARRRRSGAGERRRRPPGAGRQSSETA